MRPSDADLALPLDVELKGAEPATLQGYKDAIRGITTNHYALEQPGRDCWDQGYDVAEKYGLAPYVRFDRLRRKGKR